MRRFFWQWAVSAVALWAAAYLLREHVFLAAWYHALWLGPLLGLLNAVAGVIAGVVKLVAWPVNFLTLGCFGFLVSLALNGLAIFAISRSPQLAPYFRVESFWWGLALAVIMAVIGGLLNVFIPKPRRD